MDIWISRNDDDNVMDSIVFWDMSPGKDADGKFFHPIFNGSGWKQMSVSTFLKAFNFVPKKGTCCKYNIKMELEK